MMRTREYGTRVKLYYDGRKIEVGDFMQSQGKRGIGSTYLIEKVTHSPTIRGRRYLTCLRWPPDQVPGDATVHPLFWYAREKKRGRKISEIGACS